MLTKTHLAYIENMPTDRLIYFLQNRNIEETTTLLKNISSFIEKEKSMLRENEKESLKTFAGMVIARANGILQEFKYEKEVN